MDVIWAAGVATVRDVLDALNRGSKQRAYTTIMTTMARLDRKGLLMRERKGKSDRYTPVLDRDAYVSARTRAEVAALVERYGDLALAYFVRSVERLDPKRRRQLRALARRE